MKEHEEHGNNNFQISEIKMRLQVFNSLSLYSSLISLSLSLSLFSLLSISTYLRERIASPPGQAAHRVHRRQGSPRSPTPRPPGLRLMHLPHFASAYHAAKRDSKRQKETEGMDRDRKRQKETERDRKRPKGGFPGTGQWRLMAVGSVQ